jgi:fatty acid-binding protein DegV
MMFQVSSGWNLPPTIVLVVNSKWVHGGSMNSVRIVADSGCDLSPALAAAYQITIIPVFVRFGQEMVPSDHLTNEEFWQRAANAGEPPGTSSPAPGTFLSAFQKLVAWLAAEEFGDRVRVVDTGSFSLGMGLQVLEAAREALAGRSADFVQRTAESLRARTSIIFVLDTLEWVRRGGRLDLIIPLIDRVARTLRVKPILEMSNGEFRLVGVTRSTHSALQRLEEELRSRLPVEAVAAAYTRGCEVATELAGRMAMLLGRHESEILITEAGPAFAAHAGPKALGAAVIRS